MKRDSNPNSQWLLAQLHRLKGRTIADVFIDEDHTGFPVLLLDDETLVTVQSDPEGNGPGFLRILPAETEM
jgi:hypothetical protein